MMRPTNCLACTNAALIRQYGMYHDGCISCEGRRLVGALDSVKNTAWQRAKNGDAHAQQVCSQAKHWRDLFDAWAKNTV